GGEARAAPPDGSIRAHRLHRHRHQLPRRERVLRGVQGSEVGAARSAQAHVPRRPSGSEDGQGLLRVRRDREEEVVEDPRLDTTKAALWGTIAGIANVAALAFAPGFYPSWYFLLVAIGYGLLLPALAV